jgi:hypothetical protein
MTQATELLRDSLTPASLVYVKVFSASDMSKLAEVVNDWVDSTSSVITGVGAVTIIDGGRLTLVVTYVPAVVGENG